MRSFKNRQIQRDEVKTPDLSAFRCQIGDDNSLALEKRVRKFLKVGVFGLALNNLFVWHVKFLSIRSWLCSCLRIVGASMIRAGAHWSEAATIGLITTATTFDSLLTPEGRRRYNPPFVEYRRPGRVVEGTPLLREHAVKNCIEGSNPSVSANWLLL